MIRDLQELNIRPTAPGRRDADDFLRAVSHNYAVDVMERFCAPMPTEEPFDWSVQNLVLDDPEVKGPFDPTGREYLRDIINDNNDPDCREQTVITGTGVGKTLTNIAGIAWKIVHHPCRGLMVMPATKGEGGSETFVNSRLIPALEATRAISKLMPDGQRRLFMNSKKVRINGSHFGFVGANSSSQIASNRCGDIRMDEADKFKGRLGNEAGTGSLVKERIEGVLDYQIFQNTTPTIETGLGWKCLQRSDLRRRFLPCPHCNSEYRGRTLLEQRSINDTNLKGWLTQTWNAQYSVLPNKFTTTEANGILIPAGHIAWDAEAKRKDGSFDLDRVFRSTRIECPHCKGHILDDKKIWMDKNGLWIPTKPGTPHHKGYHLSSLYAPPLFSNENSLLGGRALKFLNAAEDGEGMKGFINSTLAEVDVSQEHHDLTVIEISTDDKPRVSSVVKIPMMSVDVQHNYPKFWGAVRDWTVSILRPPRNKDQRTQFFKTLTGEQKKLADTILGTKAEDLVLRDEPNALAPVNILSHIQRTDHWPAIATWLANSRLTGQKLTEFYQVEFQGDIIRLLEFIARQDTVKVPIGKQGDSEAIEIFSADSWEELEEIQRRHKVANPDVMVDARFGEMDNAEVFVECWRRCPNPAGFTWYFPFQGIKETRGRHTNSNMTGVQGWRPFAMFGWTPMYGYPKNKVWAGADKIRLPYHNTEHDPFKFKSEQNKTYQYLFEFDAQWALAELARVRKRNQWGIASKCQFTGNDSRMLPITVAEYNRHMKGYYWDDRHQLWIAPGKKGGAQSRQHPNHIYDAEKNMVARAVWKGIFKYQRQDDQKTN